MNDLPNRHADYPVDPLFLKRWSPRAFTGEALPARDLFTMFEAARWAPSSYNVQPWRFLYALRDSAQWDLFLGLLVEFNQSWAKNASALVFLVSQAFSQPPGGGQPVPSYSHSLDAGTASGYFALQAAQMGWHVHGMVGFDHERAGPALNAPEGHRVEAAYAVGRLADRSILPPALAEREMPSPRNPVSQFAFAGRFPG